MSDLHRLKDQVGGKWFLNLSALAFTAPFAITTSVLVSSPSLSSPASDVTRAGIYFVLIIANVLSLLICAAICLILSNSVFSAKDRNPAPLFLVVVVGACLGAAKGWLTGFFASSFGAEMSSEAGLGSRTLQAAILGAWLIPSAAFVADRLDQYRQERESLIAEKSRLALQSRPRMQSQQLTQIRDFVRASKTKLSANDPKLSETIRDLIENSLRPISHNLWQSESKKVPSFKLRELVHMATSDFPFPALWTASAFSATAFLSQLRDTTPLDSMLRSLAIWVLIFLTYRLLTMLSAKLPKVKFFLLLPVTLVLATAIFTLTRVAFGQLGSYPMLETIVASWVWLVELTLIGSIYSSVLAVRDQVRIQLAKIYDSDSLERASVQALANLQSRNVAHFLHGQVQNQLLSIALRIDHEGVVSNKWALDQIDAILKGLESEIFDAGVGSLEEELASLVSQWQGFAEITFEIRASKSIVLESVKDQIVQICLEGVANAIRHGLAKVILIRCLAKNGLVSVQVEDDGLGPRQGKEGLGTKYFDLISNRNWSLTPRNAGGSVLEVTLDVDRSQSNFG